MFKKLRGLWGQSEVSKEREGRVVVRGMRGLGQVPGTTGGSIMGIP